MCRSGRFILVMAVLATCLTDACSAMAAERVALVIGNGKYADAAALKNPANDAEAIAASLKRLDFQVTQKSDLNLAQFEAEVVQFHKSLKKGSVGLFFYAGHGVQVKGENFLVPLNTNLKEEFQVKEKCYKVDQVLDAMEEAGLKIVILDCCRDNPFTRGWHRGATSGGLAAISQIPDGTVIAFSTAPGKTAADGAGKNSPYTTSLVASLNSRPKGGLELQNALKEASRDVRKQTGQAPWMNLDASLDDFFLWKETAKRIEEPKPKESESKEKTFTNSLGMKMQLIPAGEFVMGSPDSESGYGGKHDVAEKQHRVRITKPFYMGVYPVTQADYERLMATNPSYFSSTGDGKDEVDGFSTSRFPVEQVSWEDAVKFCRKLSAKESKTYRLPTEAEWEYACRAGTTTAFYFGSSLNGDRANCNGKFPYGTSIKGDYLGRITSVGRYTANPFGLYDMHGNVWQWCSDWYSNDYYAISPLNDPQGPSTGASRVVRGGGWSSNAVNCRSAKRFYDSPTLRGLIGFRLVVDR